ncbi:MAG: hypothetical protein KAS32_21755 [Candidatus Peribacteraceae bacterium]|nr:hypothetical protein [Candidatus Peribacteraceae bacterium]
MAEKLGWKGVCFVCDSPEELSEAKRKAKGLDIDIFFAYSIKTNNPNSISKIAQKMRKKVELLLVFGGDLEINRKACETPEIDILTHPELERTDSGMDYIMAKIAKKNNVAVEFNFRNLLMSYKKSRADTLSGMLSNAKLVRKYKLPFILTSGALEPYDMRSPSEIISFGKVLGLNPKDAKSSLSDKIVKENRKRLGGKWIMPGVELE